MARYSCVFLSRHRLNLLVYARYKNPQNDSRGVYIYDRGYPSLKFIGQHQDLKVDFIFRLQRGTYKALYERIATGESDFDFTFKETALSREQTVRTPSCI